MLPVENLVVVMLMVLVRREGGQWKLGERVSVVLIVDKGMKMSTTHGMVRPFENVQGRGQVPRSSSCCSQNRT